MRPPHEIGDWELDEFSQSIEFYWFKSELVEGQTLENFLKSDANFSVREEIGTFIDCITVALSELENIGYSHGDLHDRNIMRREIGKSGALPEIQYIVIDFSETHLTEEAQEGILDDIECFGQHLRAFFDNVKQRKTLSREDESVLKALRHIPGGLQGSASELRDSYLSGLNFIEDPQDKLITPFDPVNAEYIVNEKLLTKLTFLTMAWVSDLQDNKNVLLIGPRGCGKTMVFKRLRLKTKIGAEKYAEIKKDTYVAFYLPCESLFFMRFSDLSDSSIIANRDALILFFNMAILAEVASTLKIFPKELGSISRQLPQHIYELLVANIDEYFTEQKYPGSVRSLQQIEDIAVDMLRQIRKDISVGNTEKIIGNLTFITELKDIVKKGILDIKEKSFIFFLDDYTHERVPQKLQEILDPIVSQRTPDICFKISAHMFGCIYNNPRPLALDEGRNFSRIINLGTQYLKRNTRRAEGKTLLRILNSRFKNCDDYEGRIEEWLGTTSYQGDLTISKALRDEKIRKNFHYHGIKCLQDLCTGDYSEMIRMVGAIFSLAWRDQIRQFFVKEPIQCQ